MLNPKQEVVPSITERAGQNVTISMSQHPTRHYGVPRAGRGKQLAPSQEAALIRICRARQGDQDLNSHTKSFWKVISTELLEATGRVYSWQSCRRRMLAWEIDRLEVPSDRLLIPSDRLLIPSPDPPEATHAAASASSRQNERSPSNDQTTNAPPISDTAATSGALFPNQQESDQSRYRQLPREGKGSFATGGMAVAAGFRGHELSISRESDFDDDTDDESLPRAPIPPLRRAVYNKRETEKDRGRAEAFAAFQRTITAFEAQLRCFTSAAFDDEEDQEDVMKAFQFFREKVNSAIKKNNT